MGISLKTTKLLWGASGNRCAICRGKLSEEAIDAADDDSIVGDMAHIIARKETFTRGDYDSLNEAERDHYSNLILLCRKHHKVIDDQPAHYTVERLREIKASHELWVDSALGDEAINKRRDDEAYAGIIDEWCKRIDINTWTSRGTFICSADGPQIRKDDHRSLTEVSPWIISRFWPSRYPDLESAFFNFKSVLQDYMRVLNAHLEDPSPDGDWLVTRKFYKNAHDDEQSERLYQQYDEHVCLTVNLFIELTRAINLICRRVRKNVFAGFREKEGILLVQRDMVNGFSSETYRAEYKGELANERAPYKGLPEFKRTQFEGEYYIKPEHL